MDVKPDEKSFFNGAAKQPSEPPSSWVEAITALSQALQAHMELLTMLASQQSVLLALLSQVIQPKSGGNA